MVKVFDKPLLEKIKKSSVYFMGFPGVKHVHQRPMFYNEKFQIKQFTKGRKKRERQKIELKNK